MYFVMETLIPTVIYGSFKEDAIELSKEYPEHYKRVAETNGCIFVDAAKILEEMMEGE